LASSSARFPSPASSRRTQWFTGTSPTRRDDDNLTSNTQSATYFSAYGDEGGGLSSYKSPGQKAVKSLLMIARSRRRFRLPLCRVWFCLATTMKFGRFLSMSSGSLKPMVKPSFMLKDFQKNT